MTSKQEAAKWFEQALVDFVNLLPVSARQPTHATGMHMLGVLLSEPTPAAPVAEPEAT